MVLLSCSHKEKRNVVEGQKAKIDSGKVIVFGVGDGYGYEIYLHDRKLIYQSYIPAVEGNTTFPRQDQAEKAAQLVSSKILRGLIPPTLTVDEIDSILK
jgi:hypothetical protein